MSIRKIFFTQQHILRSLFIVGVWLITIFIFVRNNIDNPNFWYDESGQFWIAKGLNHFVPFLTMTGNFADVLDNNIRYNLDPGGYSIILYFWTALSTHYIFLRLLSVSFFIMAMMVISKLCIKWSSKNYLSYFGGLIFLTIPLLTQYAFELRPYAMELFTTVLSLYFVYKIPDILYKYNYALFAGFCMAILVTSRYSAMFSVFGLFMILFFSLLKNKFNRKNFINVIIFIIPIIISVGIIYFFTFQYQNPSGTPPNYVANLMFKTGDINNILLNGKVLLTTLPFLILVLIYLLSNKNKFFKKIIKPYRLYVIYTFILNCIFIILSIIGKYPWGIDSRWNITIHTLFIIAWLPVLLMSTDFLYENKTILKKIVSIVIVFIFIGYCYYRGATFTYNVLDSTYYDIVLNDINKESKILINAGAVPTIKYLFEYGPLKNHNEIYENISVFNHKPYIYKGEVVELSRIDEYDYIILTHFDYEKSQFKKILEQKTNWQNYTKKGPTRIFKNIK